MISSNELRRGNWVNATYDGVDYKQVWSVPNMDEFAAEPIPLTPEILEKAGLRFVYDAYAIGDYIEFCKSKDGFYYVMFEGQINNPNNPIKYLHQLQNLYFCLCGEELKIDLPVIHTNEKN